MKIYIVTCMMAEVGIVYPFVTVFRDIDKATAYGHHLADNPKALCDTIEIIETVLL